MFKECGRRRTTADDDGRTTGPTFSISSPNEHKGSGELKITIAGKRFSVCIMRKG